MRILAATLIFRLVAACESMVEPMSKIHVLIRRCASAIGLGRSGLSLRQKGGGGFFAQTTAHYITGLLFI